ncbi:MAG: hypothetical protein KDA52_17290 [Planctomycetaceae bacterium]|nr:hypothetical protein [Planctomycetaceae bacterium]
MSSPVVSEWGDLFYELDPSWEELDRWVCLSKEHCLAAVDALLRFAPSEFHNDESPARYPRGATNQNIHQLIDRAIARYDNHRLREAEKRIRHVWPLGELSRHPIVIHELIKQAAHILLRGDSLAVRRWIDELETAIDPPANAEGVWMNLLTYAERFDFIGIFHHRASSAVVVGRLRECRGSTDVPLDWVLLEVADGIGDEVVPAIALQLSHSKYSLVELDTQGSDWGLAIVPTHDTEGLIMVAEDCLRRPTAVKVHDDGANV